MQSILRVSSEVRLLIGGNMSPEGGAALQIIAHSLIYECLSCFSCIPSSSSLWIVTAAAFWTPRLRRKPWKAPCSQSSSWDSSYIYQARRIASCKAKASTTCKVFVIWERHPLRKWAAYSISSHLSGGIKVASLGTLPPWESKKWQPSHCTDSTFLLQQGRNVSFSFFF